MPACEHPRSTHSKYRILYVGDDLKFIAAFREAVSESFYRLVACGDEGSANIFLKSDIPYDLLLIDHDWRGTEGLKLARVARSQRHRKRMPIVVLSTTKLDQKTEDLAQQAGVVECALKTADMNELLSRVITRDE
ncbi:MAG TPA: response regulator [Pyrinomonadaceae bacterium]